MSCDGVSLALTASTARPPTSIERPRIATNDESYSCTVLQHALDVTTAGPPDAGPAMVIHASCVPWMPEIVSRG